LESKLVAGTLLRLILVIIVPVLIMGGIVCYYLNQSKAIFSAPTSNEYPKPSPLLEVYLSPWQNVSIPQGGSVIIKVTLTSKFEDRNITIPLKITIQDTPISGSSPTPNPTNSCQTEPPLRYSFDINPVTLIPGETRESILTVTASEDAPIGSYVLLVETGNWELTHVSGATFVLKVTA